MRFAHRAARPVVVGVTVLTLVGCTSGGSGPEGDATWPSTASGEVRDVVVTRHAGDVTVQITAHPIQVKDGVAALSLDYEIVKPRTDDSVRLYEVQSMYVGQDRPEGLRLLDPEDHAYQILPSAEGKAGYPNEQDSLVASVYTTRGVKNDGQVTIDADDPAVSSVSLFVAPRTTTVDVLAPPFGVISEVPVVVAGGGFDELLALAGSPVLDDAEDFVHPMRQYDVAYDDVTTTREADQTVTIAVASDVLFASDEAALSDQATAALDRAVDQIESVAEDGTVQVVGHTDDVDTDEYNQDLSARRAQAVRDYLGQRLSDAYTITAEGRGENEPAVEGTSDEARTINRRVEIMVQRTQTVTQTTPGGVALPAPPPVVGRGLEWVAWNDQNGDHRVRVDKVVRHNGFLIGYLEVPSGDRHVVTSSGWHSDELDAARRGFFGEDATDLHNVRLLTAGGKRYPADFQERSYNLTESFSYTRILGDRKVGAVENSSQSVLVTVVWKDTGTDSVTLEVPALFRITDVPVSTEDPVGALNDTYPLRG